MPKQLKKIQAHRRTVLIDFEDGDESLRVTYPPTRPGHTFDAESEAFARSAREKAAAGEELSIEEQHAGAQQLVSLGIEWDLMDGEKPVPVTVENLIDGLGYWGIAKIWEAINKDLFPNYWRNGGAPGPG
jgi:hypothetical protein